MATTSPDNIFYADGSTPMSAAAISAAEATSVQQALSSSRAIRTYKWANKAARDLQTDMTDGDIGDQLDNNSQWRYDGTAWKPKTAGLVPIIPTSIAGTTVTVDASGLIMFTAAPSININGVFSLDFREYEVDINIASRTLTADSTIRLRTGGTDAAGANYNYVRGYDNAATRSVATVNSATSTVFDVGGQSSDSSLRFIAPALAQATRIRSIANNYNGNVSIAMSNASVSAIHWVATAYDGFSVIGGGNMAGSIRIYGRS